jgi:hypothetical protein
MATVYSGPGQVLSGDHVLLEVETAEFSFESGNNDVLTLAKGRAGHSRGAAKAMLSVTNAIPAAGPEVDWVAVAAAGLAVALGFRMAGRVYQMTGDVRDARITTDAQGANRYSFTYHASLDGVAAL